MTMKIAVLAFTASQMVPVVSLGLRRFVGDEPDQGERELLSPWCAKDTPTLWHPDYTRDWSVSGCVYKADCNQVGSSTMAECCAQFYAGQTSGDCVIAAGGPTVKQWYADYATAWAMGGCKSDFPYPIYASTLYDTQLACCKAAYAGQASGVCIGKLPSPPTMSPTMVGDLGKGWYADYSTSWSVAGCKNTLPRPIYVIVTYDTELQCCKAAYGGQSTDGCIQGLPNPPTKSPSKAPTNRPTTRKPTARPTTAQPTVSSNPSQNPSSSPSDSPTTSENPSSSPTAPLMYVQRVSSFLDKGANPLLDPIGQWYYADMRKAGTATFTCRGVNSTLRLSTSLSDSGDKAEVGINFYDRPTVGLFNGMKFKDMVAGAGITFKYDFFKAMIVAGGNSFAAPAIKIVLMSPTLGLANSRTLVWEPYWGGCATGCTSPIVTDTWHAMSVGITTGTATITNVYSYGWYVSGTTAYPNPNQEPRARLAAWADWFITTAGTNFGFGSAFMNDAVVLSVRIGVGSGNTGVTSDVNSLRIAVNGYDWQWIFGNAASCPN